ncbi:MAG: ribonuclease, partial [Bryobacteraceae bacterium]
MSKELVISANRHEIKLGILEDDQLVEVFFQRANEYSLAGSIHKGRVTRVLPGMQSAFVDLGLERDTFLYVSDFADEGGEDFDRVAVNRESSGAERGGGERGGAERGGAERGGAERGNRGERGNRPPAERQTVADRPPAQELVSESLERETPAIAGVGEPASAAAPRTDRMDRGNDRGEEGGRGRRSRRRRN